jgi:hypothetical protein
MSQIFNNGWIPLIEQQLRRYFATATQGLKADTSLQPGSIGSSVQGYDDDLQAIADLATTGILQRNGVGDVTAGLIGTANITDGAVTEAKLDASVTSKLNSVAIPAGTIFLGPWTSAPAGYLKANGAEVSRITYADLFAVLGTFYGAGDGTTTFQLPDFRENFYAAGTMPGALIPAEVLVPGRRAAL